MKLSRQSTAWLLDSPLFAYIETYKHYCIQDTCTSETIKGHLYCFAHFAHWLTQFNLDIGYINEATVHTFINNYLSNCKNINQSFVSETHFALLRLIDILHSKTLINQNAVETSIDKELKKFDDYMNHVKGLAINTRRQYLYIIKRLLTKFFSQAPIEMSLIKPEDIRQFINKQKQLYTKSGNFSFLITALRGYFRYRTTLGDQVKQLVGVANYPANWQLSSLPETLSNKEVECLLKALDTFDGSSPLRTKAIVHFALDMGLRGSEIARLSLDDINWQSGTITLRKTKSLREDIMPLPEATGTALADYLRFERPKTISNRSVFIRSFKSREQPVTYHFIRDTVCRVYAHAGLPYTRVHLLRHTMASRLLETGSSLKEVADVLRHRSLNTAMIYAKLDSRNLAEVALPWPGCIL